jgi:glycosyltransferase involved in cell wall biosynthesis
MDELTSAARRAAWGARRFDHEVVCLLPARDAEADLPGWFESVGRIADAVVALDDGSTDSTGKILADHRLVKTLLSNPRRESYRGWNDSENRSRLLAAADALRPRWIFSLDADERITADDAEALLQFLSTEALPQVAYGLCVHRMIGDAETWDRSGLFHYRVHAHRPGQRLPSKALHLVPVPTDIPRSHWFETTLRIQNVGSITAEQRRARFEKYREADPERRYQRSYDNLLEEPSETKPWRPRSAGQPVLSDPERHASIAESLARRTVPLPALDRRRPVLSAVVISQNDRGRIGEAMDALTAQRVEQPVEIILVNSGDDGTAEYVREHHPRVRVVHLPEPALPGKARNAGLAFARGDYVSFPGSHVVLPPGSLQRRIAAHEIGYCMVTGTATNGTRTLSGWASYFLDHAEALPGRPSFALWAPPSHCSYLREPLVELGGFPEDRRTGEDTFVNRKLFYSGYRAWRSAKLRFAHRSPCTNPLRLWRHHFRRGEGYGRLLRERVAEIPDAAARSRFVRRRMLRHPWKRLLFTTKHVLRWGGRQRLAFAVSLPLVVLGVLAATAGALRALREASAGEADG